MSKAPKYSFRVVEKRNKTWTAEIQRQATSKKKVVSKRQTDFATEAEGVTWAEAQLKEILATLVAKNKRHDDERAEQYQEKLKQAELQAASDKLAESYDGEDSEVVATQESEEEVIVETVANEASAQESAETTDETKTVAKFDFEIELEEAEQAEKEAATAAKKKAKAAKKVKAEDVVVEDDAPTVDGSEEVNSIYLNK